ncbi:MAG: sugar phosphate nucleotidyltransferase [Balneolaceae bacterium]
MSVKTAIILAAGMGTRLRSVTGEKFTKPLTPIGDFPVIEYSIRALINAGVERILLGCGYMIESFRYLEAKYSEVEVVENPKYDVFASIYTLLIFEDIVQEPFYLLEADIIYDPDILFNMRGEKGAEEENIILTSVPLQLDDNVYFSSDEGALTGLSKKLPAAGEPEGVMTGIWVFKEGLLSRFSQYCKSKKIDYSEDYEILLAEYSAAQEPINILHAQELNWCEIDNESHLEYAVEEVFPKIKKKLNAIPSNRS